MLRDTQIHNNTMTQTPEGLLLFFDLSRSVMLSVAREPMSFGIDHRGISNDRYLFATGKIQTQTTGYRIPRNAMVTAMTVQTSNAVTSTFGIRKNDGATNLFSLSLSGEKGKTQDNMTLLIDKDDWLQLYISNITGVVDFPIVNLEVAWR